MTVVPGGGAVTYADVASARLARERAVLERLRRQAHAWDEDPVDLLERMLDALQGARPLSEIIP